jgi:hypothetical protein
MHKSAGVVWPACPAEVQNRAGQSVARNNVLSVKQEPHMNQKFCEKERSDCAIVLETWAVSRRMSATCDVCSTRRQFSSAKN